MTPRTFLQVLMVMAAGASVVSWTGVVLALFLSVLLALDSWQTHQAAAHFSESLIGKFQEQINQAIAEQSDRITELTKVSAAQADRLTQLSNRVR